MRVARQGIRFIRKITWPLIAVTGSLSILLLLSAPLIGRVVLGDASGQTARVLQIQSFLPLIVGLHIPFAGFFLLGFGYARIWSRIALLSGGLSLIGALVWVGVFRTEHIGLSVNVVLTECFILLLSVFAYYQRRRHALDIAEPPSKANDATEGEKMRDLRSRRSLSMNGEQIIWFRTPVL